MLQFLKCRNLTITVTLKCWVFYFVCHFVYHFVCHFLYHFVYHFVIKNVPNFSY